MDSYHMFVNICIFTIGIIIGRLMMAVQYEVMKPKPKKTEDKQDSAKNL